MRSDFIQKKDRRAAQVLRQSAGIGEDQADQQGLLLPRRALVGGHVLGDVTRQQVGAMRSNQRAPGGNVAPTALGKRKGEILRLLGSFRPRQRQFGRGEGACRIGSGGDPRQPDFAEKAEARAKLYEDGGLAEVWKGLSVASNRIQLKNKNPRAFEEFHQRFMKHSALGNALVTRHVMARRPSLFSMETSLAAMQVPGLVIVGDEDGGAVESGLFLKQASPAIRLAVAPATGHLVNLEEPDLLHRLIEDFFAAIASGTWRPRGA